MSEASKHFAKDSDVFHAFRKIVRKLEDLEIPYAVVGGMALFEHGFERFTTDVDLLVTKPDLAKIHAALSGLGYLPPFENSKHLRDTEFGVRIEFLTTGDFPGDGKPKPVAFPDPADVSVEIGGVRFINLPTLVELKLASGMSNLGRLKDLADVLETIKVLKLPRDFATQLNPYVAEEYDRLWEAAQVKSPYDDPA